MDLKLATCMKGEIIVFTCLQKTLEEKIEPYLFVSVKMITCRLKSK